MIPYGRQEVTQNDIEAVVEVLRSDFLTQGDAVPRFESAVAKDTSAKYAVAVNSATSALHIACLALDLGPGDLLWTVPNTFVASANCGRYCGADIDFVDIDPHTRNMSVSCLREKLSWARTIGRLPKVVVPVHFAGHPTEQEAIWDLASEYQFRVLEDASHAIGAKGNGEPVGSCRWSDITVFSFHPVKIITSGEGGMAMTNSAELAERMRLLRTHGITRDSEKFQLGADFDGSDANSSEAVWYYEQHMLGFNYRMTDIHAALGASQLTRLADYVARRNRIADRFNAELKELPIELPVVLPGNLSAYHLYVVRIVGESAGDRRNRLFDELRACGIGVNLHYWPVHLQPYYQRLGFRHGDFPVAESHAASAVTLPLYPTLTDEAQDFVIHTLKEIVGQ